jgi:hypothetical protein
MEHDMSELNDFNQRVISEFRANQGKVAGQLAGMPLLLLTTTGAKTGRALTSLSPTRRTATASY